MEVMPIIRDAETLKNTAIHERARLLRYLASRGISDEAEDLWQDLWHRLGSVRAYQISRPVAYCFAVAENLARDRRRSLSRQRSREQAWFELRLAPEEVPGCDRVLISKNRLAECERTLEDLGPRVFHLLRRFRMDDVAQTELATEFGISLSSVEKDLQKAYRALALLKSRFDEEDEAI